MSVVGRLFVAALTAVPRIIDAVRGAASSGKRTLDPPLGESEAARALRLEEQRRAELQARRTLLELQARRTVLLADERLCGECPNAYPLKLGEACGMCGRIDGKLPDDN